jgi:uroporphyrinogen-III decarboxylase
VADKLRTSPTSRSRVLRASAAIPACVDDAPGGRYLPEYRALRRTKAGSSIWSTIPRQPRRSPPAAAPLRLDAAILFSDILIVPHASAKADVRRRRGPTPQSDLKVAALKISPLRRSIRGHLRDVRRVKAALSPQTTFWLRRSPWTSPPTWLRAKAAANRPRHASLLRRSWPLRASSGR